MLKKLVLDMLRMSDSQIKKLAVTGDKRQKIAANILLHANQAIEDGGKGSGNFGHKGRPGLRGGSGKGGGSAFRTKTSSGDYVGVTKAKAFKSIARIARQSKDLNSFVKALSVEQRDQINAQYLQSGSNKIETLQNYVDRLRMLMASQPSEKRPEYKLVDGRDMSDEIGKSPEPYTEPKFGQVIDTQIEHIINQQGFNGVPKVVSTEEFNKILNEHPEMPLLLRSYAAQNPEILQDFDDQLESGQWYVDCGTGGAQYGQGMYCAGVYETDPARRRNVIQKAMEEMEHYRNLNIDRCIENYTPPNLKPTEGYVEDDDGDYLIYDKEKLTDWDSEQPEIGQEVAVTFTSGNYTRTVAGTWDGERVTGPNGYPSTTVTGVKAKAEWAPIDRKDDKSSLMAQASTRAMTLDPSAKIISHFDAQKLRSDYAVKQGEKVYDKFEDSFRQNNKLDDDDMQLIKEVRLMNKSRFNRQQHVNKVDAYYERARRDGKDVDRLANLANQFTGEADAAWEKANKTRDIYLRMDIGVVAAAYGYDAINAEGHGLSASYTVVLNRTKVILADRRVNANNR